MNSPTREVEVKVLDRRLEEWGLPRYQSEMAAAIDLFACVDGPVELMPGAPAAMIPSGLAVHIGDPGIAAIVLPRSGLGHKKGLVLGNLIGLVDADYTGPVLISAWNRSGPSTQPIIILPGERIAQLMFVPVVRPKLEIVSDFTRTTKRGSGGFGSTGVANK
jgi:dUTP pyrophosphatase